MKAFSKKPAKIIAKKRNNFRNLDTKAFYSLRKNLTKME